MCNPYTHVLCSVVRSLPGNCSASCFSIILPLYITIFKWNGVIHNGMILTDGWHYLVFGDYIEQAVSLGFLFALAIKITFHESYIFKEMNFASELKAWKQVFPSYAF